MPKARSSRTNASRAPRTDPRRARCQVFIMEGTKDNCRPFVVSVGHREDMAAAAERHGLRDSVIKVAHWQQISTYGDHPMEGWTLIERFSL